MSYVTLSDHDSIEGALYLLNRYPDLDDFFISEEVETYFPETRQRVHLGVYGLDEEQHREIQRLRADIRELIPYLKSRNIVFAVNHLLQNYRMKNVAEKYIAEMIEMCDVFEVLNGAMASSNNKVVYRIVASLREKGRRISMVGGSDAHTLKHIGKVYTVSRADSIPQFIENVRSGDCFAWGQEMRFTELVTDIYGLILAYYGHTRSDLESLEYTSSDKTLQLIGRLAGIPTAMSGLPAAITTLNYLKQILVSQGITWKLPRLFEALEQSDQNENDKPPVNRI